LSRRIVLGVGIAILCAILAVVVIRGGSTPDGEPSAPRIREESSGTEGQEMRSGGSVSAQQPEEVRAPIPQPEDQATNTELPPRTAGATETARLVTAFLSSPVNPAQKQSAAEATKKHRGLFAYAGALDYDNAKELMSERERAVEQLLEQLSQLGAGGPRAVYEAYSDTDRIRQKSLLITALAETEGTEADLALAAICEAEMSQSLTREAIAALGARDSNTAELILLDILATESDPRLRFAGVQALAGREGSLVALAESARSDTDAEVRSEAIHALARIDTAAAMNAVGQIAAEGTDLHTTQVAIQELARTFGSDALGHLAGLLNSSDEAIRHNTVKALGRLPGDESRQLLRNTAEKDPSPAIRDLAQGYL
jgi:HEAT repeat protein